MSEANDHACMTAENMDSQTASQTVSQATSQTVSQAISQTASDKPGSMKLQAALDYYDLESALAVLDQIHDKVDIVEVGTPLILHSGVQGVRTMRQKYPKLCILADLKIMDGGYEEADMYFKAGANIVTVMALANLPTIEGVARAAHENGGQCAVDMMNVVNMAERVRQVETVGADIICVHTAYDVQNVKGSPLVELAQVNAAKPRAMTAIAGGVSHGRMPEIIKERPDIVIVGGGIVKAADKGAAIRGFREFMC